MASNIGTLPPYLQNLNKGGMSMNPNPITVAPVTAQQYPQSMAPVPAKPLVPAQAPTNVAKVNPNTITTVKTPVNTPQTGNITQAAAANMGAGASVQAQLQQNLDLQSQKAAADKAASEQATTKKSIFDFLSSAKSPSQARADAVTETGINTANYFADQQARIAEIGSLTQDYNNLNLEKQQKIDQAVQASGGTLAGAEDKIRLIEKDYNLRLSTASANINARSAVMKALEGNFNEAQDFVKQAVADATADTKFKFDTLSSLYDMNQDSINRLDTQYKDAMKNAIDIAKMDHEENVKIKQEVGDLIVSNPNAGININDSLEEAYRKFAAAGGKATTGSGSGTPATLEERTALTVSKIGSLFAPTMTIPNSGGVPFVDVNGFATPEGWKAAQAISGLARDEFIKSFGYLIPTDEYSKYGLTPKEVKLITG